MERASEQEQQAQQEQKPEEEEKRPAQDQRQDLRREDLYGNQAHQQQKNA